MASNVPRLPANGANLPAIGLGTSKLRDCVRSIESALSVGYRHIDTAHMYGNEVEVGQALRNSGLPRGDLFVTTKVLAADINAGDLQASAAASLERLKLDYVDLLLIHWPNDTIPLATSIKALCDAKERGYAKAIGVANFRVSRLEEAVRLAASHGAAIATNQCEYHPRLDQTKLLTACRAHGVAFVSYCPLGQGYVAQEPTITAIAQKLGRTPGQVVMRWHVQQPGVAAIPKSGSREHQTENLSVFDFVLDDADMAAISGLRRPDGRILRAGDTSLWDAA